MVIVLRYDSFGDSIATLLTILEITKLFKTEKVIPHQFLHPRTNSVWRRFKCTLDYSFFRRYNASVIKVNRTYSGIHSTITGNSGHEGNKEVADSGRRSPNTQWYAEWNTLGKYTSTFLAQTRNEGLCPRDFATSNPFINMKTFQSHANHPRKFGSFVCVCVEGVVGGILSEKVPTGP